MIRKLLFLVALALWQAPAAMAQKGYKLISDLSYISPDDTSAYRRERCKLDIYYPEGTKKPFKRSEEHTSELQSRQYLVCRLLLEKKKNLLSHLCFPVL